MCINWTPDWQICIYEILYNVWIAEDWPGFDIPPVRSESLWDPQYNPRDQVWSTATDAEPTNVSDTVPYVWKLLLSLEDRI